MYNNLINLKNAALEAGITLLVSSGYRDAFDDIIYEGEQIAESQLSLRKKNVLPKYVDVKNPADRYIRSKTYTLKKMLAPPGYSKHNNGTAIDFNTGSRTGALIEQLRWIFISMVST
jgi:LAS superfamily LD-carboxypeptidase LdcB